MPFTIVRNDITKMEVDAIVNAANNQLKQGGGVCGAIFNAAGAKNLQAECNKIGFCRTGGAVATKGYDLPASTIIHAVGPVWNHGKDYEEALLRNCYINSLALAKKRKIKSIAFPLISSGIFGYPKDQALEVATEVISDYLKQNDMDIYLVVYDKASFAISQKRFSAVEKFIDENYIKEHFIARESQKLQNYNCEDLAYQSMITGAQEATDLEGLLENLSDTFSEMLFRLIDKKGMTDVDVYKKANVDRKLFSKIRSNKHYQPSKPTAIAFAIALELSFDETQDLLRSAGYALSRNNKFDIIIEYFISEKTYNIFELNETLFAFDQPLLGA